MNVSLNWLKDYLKIDQSTEEICKILTSIGLEVGGYEEFEAIKGGLKGLVIGARADVRGTSRFRPPACDDRGFRYRRTGTNCLWSP